jgi:DNA repair protein RecO (recombination protein O)
MSDSERVLLEHGFVLHQRAYRNTSQLLECLTEQHGRVGLVARGSRRATSGQRALLQPFVPLRLSWVKRGELGGLTHVEAAAASCELTGQHLLAGYYANELLLRLTARDDPNPAIFSCYSRCLAELADGAQVARTMRIFEMRLLEALGYGLAYEAEHGLRATAFGDPDDELFSGRELISLREHVLDDEQSLRAAQRLLGRVLRLYLGERPLKSRLVLQDIVRRGL